METTVEVELVPVAHGTRQVLSVRLTKHWDCTGHRPHTVRFCSFEADISPEELAAALRTLANDIEGKAGGN